MRGLLSVLPFFIGLVGCDVLGGDPCTDWVDYVCQCHADDPAYSCETVRIAHENADVEHYEDCQIALDEAQAQDALSGYECLGSDTGGGSSETGL